MADENSEVNLPSEEQLKALLNKDSQALQLLVARSALRVLPLLVKEAPDFGYWRIKKASDDEIIQTKAVSKEARGAEAGIDDRRLPYLLAVWRANIIAWQNSIIDDKADIIAAGAAAAGPVYSARAYSDAAAADAAAKAARDAAYADAARDAAYAASEAAHDAHYAAYTDAYTDAEAARDVTAEYVGGAAAAAAGTAYYAVVYTSATADSAEAANAVANAVHNAIAVAKAVANAAGVASAAFPAIKNALHMDYDWLSEDKNSTVELRLQPLWPEGLIPGEIDKLIRGPWPAALHRLSQESAGQHPQTVEILSAIEQGYQAILQGDPQRYVPRDTILVESVAKQDQLSRDALVGALAAKMRDPDNTEHFVVGLLGDWGVGKSSVLAQLKERLQPPKNSVRIFVDGLKNLRWFKKGPPRFLYGEFNAWSYEHTDNIQAGVAQQALEALSGFQYQRPQQADWPNPAGIFQYGLARLDHMGHWLLRECLWGLSRVFLVIRFAVRLHGSQIMLLLWTILLAKLSLDFKSNEISELNATLASIPGVSSLFYGGGALGLLFLIYKQGKTIFAHPLAKELKTYLRLPQYGKHLGTIPVMRDHIRALCDIRLHDNKRLLFVIDDLDRCGPKGIVKTFEAVRLVMDIPNVSVVIAVDHRIALAALALHYQDLAEHHQLGNPQAIARDYLGKMMHLSIRLGEPDEIAVNNWLAHLWNDRSWLGLQVEKIDAATQTNDKPRQQGGGGFTGADKVIGAEGNAQDVDIQKLVEETSQLSQAIKETFQSPSINKAQIPGLSPAQKIAMSYWLKNFGLKNPRQVKRLLNTYDVLRAIRNIDKLDDDMASDKLSRNFPIMVTLILIEYIFTLEMALRQPIRELIQSREQVLSEDFCKLLTERQENESLTITNRLESVLEITSPELWQEVEPFVLPAIEVCVEDNKNSSVVK